MRLAKDRMTRSVGSGALLAVRVPMEYRHLRLVKVPQGGLGQCFDALGLQRQKVPLQEGLFGMVATIGHKGLQPISHRWILSQTRDQPTLSFVRHVVVTDEVKLVP